MRVKAIDQTALAGNYESQIIDLSLCEPGFVAEFIWDGTLDGDVSIHASVSEDPNTFELIPGATMNTGGAPGFQKISDVSDQYDFIKAVFENYAGGVGNLDCVVSARDLK